MYGITTYSLRVSRALLIVKAGGVVSARVQLARNGVNNGLDLGELLLELLQRRTQRLRVDPVGGILDGCEERLLSLSLILPPRDPPGHRAGS